MLTLKGPAKTFYNVLVKGIFNIGTNKLPRSIRPPTNLEYIIDNGNDYLIDNQGNYLIIETPPQNYMVDNGNNYLIDNQDNYLVN